VLESFARLEAACDIVVVEGAGSPAEINLRDGDIANMGFARAAGVPVVLVGDIDRGGVIAAVVGTRAVLDPDDAAMIRGFIINKFRGDPSLFADGYQAIAQRSGWRGFGVVPWLGEAVRLPSEDAVVLEQRRASAGGRLLVACPILPRIANFDDLDPLKIEPGVEVVMIAPGTPIPAEAGLIVLPGSKATLADMADKGAGLGYRHAGASPAGRRHSGHLRGLSDAGPQHCRSAGAGGRGGRNAGAGAARCGNRAGRSQGAAQGAGQGAGRGSGRL
jgi:adenosylcobyric acid synthase